MTPIPPLTEPTIDPVLTTRAPFAKGNRELLYESQRAIRHVGRALVQPATVQGKTDDGRDVRGIEQLTDRVYQREGVYDDNGVLLPAEGPLRRIGSVVGSDGGRMELQIQPKKRGKAARREHKRRRQLARTRAERAA